MGQYADGREGGTGKTENVQQFLKNHLKFAAIFDNILRKSGRPLSIFGEVKKFLRNKILGIEEIL